MGFFMIWFEEADVPPEIFTDEECANKRFDQVSTNWNATLFRESRRNFKLEGEKWPSDEGK